MSPALIGLRLMDIILVALIAAGAYWFGRTTGYLEGRVAGRDEGRLRARLESLSKP